jgi:hypothetical protein
MPKLIIGDRVYPEELPKNTFTFEVSQMSGDADAYNDETFLIKGQERAIAFAQLLTAIADIQYCGDGRSVDEVIRSIQLDQSILQVATEGLHLRDLIWNVCGSDVTCEGCLASLDGFEIFWYNEAGEKFKVEFKE